MASTYVPYSGMYGRQKQGPTNRANRTKPDVYGPETVWAEGVAYPNARWAAMRVVPVEHPYKKGIWVHPNRVSAIEAQYARNKSMTRAHTERKVNKAVSGDVSNAVTGGLNKVSDALSNEAANVKKAGDRAAARYRAGHKEFDVKNNRYVDTGNILGETAARIGGAAKASAAGKAISNEASNIASGADRAAARYRAGHKEFDVKNNRYVDTGNVIGETAARIAGGVGASAVGRAGKAAFKAITDKIDDFKKGIKKYLTGPSAKLNRSRVLEDLQAKAGGLMSSIRSALGSSEGRARTLGTIQGAISGTVGGIASGIRNSDIGKAAYESGKKAYGAVKDKIGSVLDSITGFFKKKPQVKPKGRFIEGATI